MPWFSCTLARMTRLWSVSFASAAAFPVVLVAVIARFCPIDPLPADWQPAPEARGVYAPNKVLQAAERFGAGHLSRPEDIAVDKQGRLYTGCKDGWIKRISPQDGRVENWAYVGGHPLGLVVGRYGELLVCEPAMGLLNVTESKVEVLSSEADGIKYKIADELDVAQDNTVYFTDASYKWGVTECRLDVLEGRPNGRLMKYDPVTRTTTVLLKDLYFPNGVALSLNEDFLVFCETSKLRCQRYWLKGEKTGATDIFIDGLPGFPDNIHLNANGDFWIALVSGRLWHIEAISRSTFLKKLISPFMLSLYDESFGMAKVLAVSEHGEPLTFYEDPTGKAIAFATTALQVGNYLYLGNLAHDYIGRLKLNASSEHDP